MSQVQIINTATPIKVASATNKIIIPNTAADVTGSLVVTHDSTAKLPAIPGTSAISDDQSMYRSPLKKRPYKISTSDMVAEEVKQARTTDMAPVSTDCDANVTVEPQHVVIVDAEAVADQQVGDIQSVNMADVASTVYDAYLETVQFTFNNTITMRQNLNEKLVSPACNPSLEESLATACWKAYEARFNEAITDVVNFAKRIPGFAALETDDQIILIKGGSFEVGCWRCLCAAPARLSTPVKLCLVVAGGLRHAVVIHRP